MNEQYRNKIFDQEYRLARALVMKYHDGIKNKRKARMMLQEIAQEEIIDYNITRVAMATIFLCAFMVITSKILLLPSEGFL